MIKFHQRPLDLFCCQHTSAAAEYCFLTLTWGATSDIDIGSETWVQMLCCAAEPCSMRWAGDARLTMAALAQLVHRGKFHGRLYYLPHPHDKVIAQCGA